MATGDDGFGFNQLRKASRLLTPKLIRKRISHSADTAEKDKCDDDDDQPDTASSDAVTCRDDSSSLVLANDLTKCKNHCQKHSCCINNCTSQCAEIDNTGSIKHTLKKKAKSLSLKKKKTNEGKIGGKSFSKLWTFKIKRKSPSSSRDAIVKSDIPTQSCLCTGLRRNDELPSQNPFRLTSGSSGRLGTSASPIQPTSSRTARLALGAGPGPSGVCQLNPPLFQLVPAPQNLSVIDLTRTNADDYAPDDIDDMMIAQRARDMELGIEISPSHSGYPHLSYNGSVSSSSSSGSSGNSEQANLNIAFQNQCVVTTTTLYSGAPPVDNIRTCESFRRREAGYRDISLLQGSSSATPGNYIPRTVHTQIDYIHCLVPDLGEIAKFPSYWGVIDRYEAERLLENRPEGTFLLRDSAQEEFLFSVSFRRYGRSLHARIEQWNHKFSFDSHDPGVFASETVCGLIEHYKDPSCCMFFEPMLTNPLNRTFPFSLQHLCRTVICSATTYDGLNFLPLPKSLRDYLKYYHYKQKVRVRRFEVHH